MTVGIWKIWHFDVKAKKAFTVSHFDIVSFFKQLESILALYNSEWLQITLLLFFLVFRRHNINISCYLVVSPNEIYLC